MTNEQFQQYMKDQIHTIEESKWYEGERIGRDPGQQYVMEWIQSNSIHYRVEWATKHDLHT